MDGLFRHIAHSKIHSYSRDLEPETRLGDGRNIKRIVGYCDLSEMIVG